MGFSDGSFLPCRTVSVRSTSVKEERIGSDKHPVAHSAFSVNCGLRICGESLENRQGADLGPSLKSEGEGRASLTLDI